jgi:hypothetical protein
MTSFVMSLWTIELELDVTRWLESLGPGGMSTAGDAAARRLSIQQGQTTDGEDA